MHIYSPLQTSRKFKLTRTEGRSVTAQGYRDAVAGRGKEGDYKGARRGDGNVSLLVVYMYRAL